MINVFFSHWDSEAMPQQLIQQTRGQAFGRFVWNFRMQFVSRLVTEYAETICFASLKLKIKAINFVFPSE